MEIRVSAPGKIILMGEHAAVYGRPALVAAVDRRVEARLERREIGTRGPGTLHLVLPQLEVDEHWTWPELKIYAAKRRSAWQQWHGGGLKKPFSELVDDRPSQLVATAIGEALQDASSHPDFSATLEIRSDLPVSAGFGSSAAASAAVIQAILASLGEDIPKPRLERLCLEAERRQHGTPSGVDGAAVVRGGLLWAEKEAETLKVEEVSVSHEAFFDHLLVAHSGPAAESTGEVVAAVRNLRQDRPAEFEVALDRAAAVTRGLRADLESCDASENSDIEDRVRRRIQEFSAWLVSIGVVPRNLQSSIHRVEKAGGAAKISGAGSLRGPGSGSFLIYHRSPEAGRHLLRELPGLRPMDLRLGAPGARVENAG